MSASGSDPDPAAGPGDTRTWSGGRAGGGYVASVVGALGGAAVGAVGAAFLGPLAFRYAVAHLQVHPDETGNGIEDALAGIGAAIATGVVAVAAAVLLAVLCLWFGSVLGCGLALRVCDCGHARGTALAFGTVLPLIFVVLALVVSRFGRIEGDAAAVLYLVSVGLAAYLARRLTLNRR